MKGARRSLVVGQEISPALRNFLVRGRLHGFGSASLVGHGGLRNVTRSAPWMAVSSCPRSRNASRTSKRCPRSRSLPAVEPRAHQIAKPVAMHQRISQPMGGHRRHTPVRAACRDPCSSLPRSGILPCRPRLSLHPSDRVVAVSHWVCSRSIHQRDHYCFRFAAWSRSWLLPPGSERLEHGVDLTGAMRS